MTRYPLALCSAVLLGGILAGPSSGASSHSRPLEEIGRARRSFAARLSVGTAYRPCRQLPVTPDKTVPREACGAPGKKSGDIAVLAAAGNSADVDSVRASALAEVIWWDATEAAMDTAISRLSRVLDLGHPSVSLLVDLSGAHLVRAERTQNPRDLIAGLDYALDALTRDSRNEPALFNAALALDAFAIDGQASHAWDRYLAVDSASQWAGEARRRRSVLRRRRPAERELPPGADSVALKAFVAAYPQAARLLGWDEVLGDWGRAVVRGDSEWAASRLALAERLGEELRIRNGDLSLSDAVDAIQKLKGSPAATRKLAKAHKEYAAGQVLYDDKEFSKARGIFEGIIAARPPSPALVRWARVFQGGSFVSERNYPQAESVLAAILATPDSGRYPAITARARWMRSTMLLRKGDYQEARAQYDTAVWEFERLGETEFRGANLGLLGETTYEQGDTLAAYRAMHSGLLALRGYRNSLWLHNLLMNLALSASEDGMKHASVPIQDEDVTVAMRIERGPYPVEALMARARMRAIAGRIGLAVRDLDDAEPLLAGIKAEDPHEHFRLELHFSRAVVEPGRASMVMLDSAVTRFADNLVWLIPTLMRRADARLAIGDTAGATADLEMATAKIRSLSVANRTDASGSAMIEQARTRFDQLVMLHIRAGNTDDALRVLERGRTSFGPDEEQSRGSRLRGPQNGVAEEQPRGSRLRGPQNGVAEEQPRGSRLRGPRNGVAAEYALIGDTLLIWTVRDSTAQLTKRRINRAEFLRRVKRVGALETTERAAAASADLDSLYDQLIRPVKQRLGDRETPLVILADGEIAGVPFAALRYQAGKVKRYLIQDHPLRFAATLAHARREPQPRGRHEPRTLLVSDPAFDGIKYAALARLPGAKAETDLVQGLYPNHMLLADREATRDSMIREAPRSDIIHYAGHAVFDDARPERSYLVLAGRGEEGRLDASRVNDLHLSRVRLVVLSACSTLRTREGRSGGFAGLSGALLAAGAGGVVGSMWTVDDQSAQRLMMKFHREYRRTGDAAASLRRAQLELLGDSASASPSSWAGFRYAGR